MKDIVYDIRFKIGRINWLRLCFNKMRSLFLYLLYYRKQKILQPYYGVVFCIDGHLHHGGFADRFFGILQTYALCKIYRLSFKLNFCHPFDLSCFLEPAGYDWKIHPSEISYNSMQSMPVVMLGDYLWYKKFKICTKKNKQIHFYANVDILDNINSYYKTCFNYNSLYNELFKPTERLLSSLSYIKHSIPQKYMSLCFRHRNLFNDFKEKGFQPLDKIKTAILLDECISKIKTIIHMYDCDVIVTSDSLSFLNKIRTIPRVYIVNQVEELVHMDYRFSAAIGSFEQSFIDFYLLGGGDIIFLLGLYSSGFPILASKCFSKKLEVVLEKLK